MPARSRFFCRCRANRVSSVATTSRLLWAKSCAGQRLSSGRAGPGSPRPHRGLGWVRYRRQACHTVPAGMGLALFELYSATRRPDFLEIGRGAFAFEDALFDPVNGNWPDLRRNIERPNFARSWCHGAPGIALARLRAGMLDDERREEYYASARIAIATTLGAIEENLETAWSDATLCHGLAGLGEIVWLAGKMLNDTAYCDRALDLGRILINRHSDSEVWPSGVPSRGPNPSLMLGIAGIGYWLLRLHAPERVPSILLMNPHAGRVW